MQKVASFCLVALFFLPAPASAKSNILVQLFGQNCQLKGEVDAKVLEKIHAISPAEMPRIVNLAQGTKQLKRVRKTTKLPNALHNYRSRLLAHTRSMVAFYQALGALKTKKKRNFPAFLKVVKPTLKIKDTRDLNRKFQAYIVSGRKDAKLAPLLEEYRNLIERKPEQEFHDAIRGLDIHYRCDLEAGGPEDDEEEETDEKK